MKELFGVAASVAVWALGIWSLRRCYGVALARVPAAWLAHPVAGPALRAGAGEGWQLRRLASRLASYFAVWVATNCLMLAADVSFAVELTMCGLVAWLNTTYNLERRRDSNVRFADEHGLEPLPRIRWLRLWDAASTWLTWLGYLATACFVARLVFALT